MKKLLLSLLALACAASASLADNVENAVIYVTSTAVQLTGTGVISTVTLSGTGQQFVITDVKVAVTSSTACVANPVLTLKNGSVALTATTAITGTSGYVTNMPILAPEVLTTTGTAGSVLTLVVTSTANAAQLSGRVLVKGFYLK